ncbi:hypothetical protein Cgig2_008866 [Carnegiea gigantea]|uniref:SRR1-like domain-containing protein n=1 Tax=Carnegiea gigantea TaxID=171969 RepID=A0A9Q1JIJ3_9CARY|nr:hypothetical protein Cgig2_008866 [Carnegiea gigantea]
MAAAADTMASDNNEYVDPDWIVVLPRRKRRKTQSKVPSPAKEVLKQAWAPTDLEIDSERESKVMQKMQSCLKKLETSKFYELFLNQVQGSEVSACFSRVLGSEPKMNMVIYGIGSIESFEAPRLQLSLAMLMKRKLDWIGDMEVFDPVLSATESRVLESLGCSVMSVNEEGRRQVLKPTLFFMPHFIKDYVASDYTKRILAARCFTDEFRIATGPDDHSRAFHESSWHFFSPDAEQGLPSV